jgi:hypothetical protein
MRERRKPERYSPPDFCANFVLSITDDHPITVEETMNLEDSKLWKKAMVEEMDAFDKNEAWDLVEFPTGRKAIGNKWVFKKKLNACRRQSGEIQRLVSSKRLLPGRGN